MRNSLPKIQDQAKGRWRAILAAIGLDEKTLSGKHGPCPLPGCGGKDRFVFDDKDGTGSYFCRKCGAGQGMKLVMALRGLEFREAAKLVRELIPSAQAVATAKERTREQKGESLRRMWEKSAPIAENGVVSRYLASRCIAAASPSLREARLPYYDDGRKVGEYHAMVARIATVEGNGASLHITYLTPEGKKAPVASPKKIMSPVLPIMGAAVQLKSAGEILGVAEGIETALSASEKFDLPVWATMNAEGMAAFIWPPMVKRLMIFADHDRNYAGHKAAYALAFRAVGKDLAVEVHIPQLVDSDWNDVVISERALRRAA